MYISSGESVDMAGLTQFICMDIKIMRTTANNTAYDTFYDPDLVMPPLKNPMMGTTKQSAAFPQTMSRAATLSTYSGDALSANPRRSYSTDRSTPSAEHLIASLYGKNRAVPEPRKLNDTTFVDTLPINKPAMSVPPSNSAYDKLIKDPSKRQSKALAKVDKESLMDEIQSLRKQKNALEELIRKQQTRISRLEEILKSRDKELQNLTKMMTTGIPDPTKVTDMMALKQKESAPTMDYVKGLKHKMKEYYVRNQELLEFIAKLKESMNFQRMRQLEKNLLIYYDKYNQLRVKNGSLNQHCIELEEELGVVHDKMLQSLRASKKYQGMRLSEDYQNDIVTSTSSGQDGKHTGPSAHASLISGSKQREPAAEPDGKFVSDIFDVSNVVPNSSASAKAIQDQLSKHSMALQTSMISTQKKPTERSRSKARNVPEHDDPIAEIAARFYESRLERERKRLECSFIPDVPAPLEQIEYKLIEDEFDEFLKKYRNNGDNNILEAQALRQGMVNPDRSRPNQGSTMVVSRDTGAKQAQTKNEKLARRLVTEIKRSEVAPAVLAQTSNSHESTGKVSPTAMKREDNPYFTQRQPSKDNCSEKPTSVSGNRPYEDTDNGSTICDWNSFVEPEMVSRVGVTITEVTSAGGSRPQPKTPLSDTSGLGGDSKPQRNPNSFYPNPPSQSDKSAPIQSALEEDSGVKTKELIDLPSNPENEPREDNSKSNQDETEQKFSQKQQKNISYDPLLDRSLNDTKTLSDATAPPDVASLKSSPHATDQVQNTALAQSMTPNELEEKPLSSLPPPDSVQDGAECPDDDEAFLTSTAKQVVVSEENDGVMNDSLNITQMDSKRMDTKTEDISLGNATFDSGVEENSILNRFPLTNVAQTKQNNQSLFSQSQIEKDEPISNVPDSFENQAHESKTTTKDYSSLVLDSHMFDDPKATQEPSGDATKDYSSLQLYSGMFDAGNQRSAAGHDSVRDYSSLQLHSAMFDEPPASKSHPLHNSGDYSSLQLYSGMFDAPDEEPDNKIPPSPPPKEPHYPANPKIKIIESSGTESTAFTIEGTEPSAFKAYSQSTTTAMEPSAPRQTNPFQKLQLEDQEIAFSHNNPVAEESSSMNSSASHPNPRDGGED